MRKAVFWLLLLAIPVSVTGLALYLSFPAIEERTRPFLLAYVANNLSAEERDTIYGQIAADTAGRWDTVPEPDVARTARPNDLRVFGEIEVRTNNAGMRSPVDFVPKPDGVFRIVCLGDSFVEGAGVNAGERFCDRLGEFYDGVGAPAGKRVEAYSVGLGSWTLVQEATYLSSRISDYAPDVILLLAVSNDIGESYGVTGAGVLTREFSPESRSWGSGVFHNRASSFFGQSSMTVVQWDVSAESRTQWDKAMGRLSRLADLQHRMGGRLLISVLNPNNRFDFFAELFKYHLQRTKIKAPHIEVTFFRDEGKLRRPNDGHPNVAGHRFLSDQYVHALDSLGWLPVEDDALPILDERIRLDPNPGADPEEVAGYKASEISKYLRESIDFDDLPGWATWGFLGGIFPARIDDPFSGAPWAAPRAGFLLLRPTRAALDAVEIKIAIPPRTELWPLELRLKLNGSLAETFTFRDDGSTGVRTMVAPLPPIDRHDPAQGRVVEVVIETTSYFTAIADARMKSYQLVSARLIRSSTTQAP